MKNMLIPVTMKSTAHFAAKEAGGKGHNLFLLKNNSINVPDFIVLPPSFFNHFIEESQIESYIQNIINDQHLSLKEISEKISKKITETPFSFELSKRIEEIYLKLNKKLISVRSSAHDEDGSTHSFAGQLSSFLYIETFEKTLESLKECWASAYSERSLHYRIVNKIDIQNIKVSVVFQEMIDPDISGVLFTSNPIKGSSKEMVINSVYGVGEGLVSGLLDADTFIVKKDNFEVLERTIVEKNKKLVRDNKNQKCLEVEVEKSKVEVSSLSDQEITELTKLGLQIENFYGQAQDIEWAIKDHKFYILQSRPVTTETHKSIGTLYVWDNSNIVESYGGHTLPLTFGFAHYVYHQVYVQFCEILLVPPERIKEMDYFLKNMLGLFYGRVYYNLLNWYKLTSILPGYKYNRSFMETMMGTNESLQDEIAERVKPPEFHHGLGSSIRQTLTGLKFFYFHLNIQSIVDQFLIDFHRVYDRYRKLDFSRMPADQIYTHYQKLEKELLWKWHAPIINDFLCMVHYGLFKKLTQKWLSHLGDSYFNDLLAGNGNLESAEPTKELIRLSAKVSADENLKKLILNTSNSDCLEALNQSVHQAFYLDVKNYIDRFGFRCMSEMKLEQKDLHQDPSLFFVFLKNILNSNQTNLEQYEKREKEIRDNAEKKLNENLSGIKKIIYRWSLKNARQAVMNRENTRFCRTRIYGVVRSMFYGMGNDFRRNNILDFKEDIFYLSLEELKGTLEGTNSILNLRAVVELRKKEYDYFKTVEPAARFFTRGTVYYGNLHTEVEEETAEPTDLLPNQMKGTPCSPGIIEGVVKVIMGPEDDLTLNKEILVTERTDPGWIPLYPSISALLVERGGLLSHSAIVAREMGLPTIVGIKGLTKKLKNGDRIRINGETGLIEILE